MELTCGLHLFSEALRGHAWAAFAALPPNRWKIGIGLDLPEPHASTSSFISARRERAYRLAAPLLAAKAGPVACWSSRSRGGDLQAWPNPGPPFRVFACRLTLPHAWACGFLVEREPADEPWRHADVRAAVALLPALRANLARTVQEPAASEPHVLAPLSATERRVARLLFEGMTEAGVAHRMDRSPHTVHVHVKSIYRKLGVSRRRELRALLADGGSGGDTVWADSEGDR